MSFARLNRFEPDLFVGTSIHEDIEHNGRWQYEIRDIEARLLLHTGEAYLEHMAGINETRTELEVASRYFRIKRGFNEANEGGNRRAHLPLRDDESHDEDDYESTPPRAHASPSRDAFDDVANFDERPKALRRDRMHFIKTSTAKDQCRRRTVVLEGLRRTSSSSVTASVPKIYGVHPNVFSGGEGSDGVQPVALEMDTSYINQMPHSTRRSTTTLDARRRETLRTHHTQPASNCIGPRATSHEKWTKLSFAKNHEKKRGHGPGTLETSHKAQKTTDGAIQLPADRDASPRDTPRRRRRPAHNRPAIDPLDLPGPSSLNVITGTDIFDGDENSDSGGSAPPPPYAGGAPAPLFNPAAPPVINPAPQPAANPIPVPIVNPAPAPIVNPVPQPAANPAPQPALNPAPQAAANPAPAHAPGLVLPTVRGLAAVIPASKGYNPHLRFLAAQDAPPIDAELGRARFQQSTGRFRDTVVPNRALDRGIAPTHLEDWETSPGFKISLVIANGGNHLLRDVTFEVPLITQVKAALRVLAPNGNIDVQMPIADPNAEGTGKYDGAISLLARVSDPAGAAKICAQKAFALHTGVAFFAIDHDNNRGTRLWSFTHLDAILPTGEVDVEEVVGLARGGLIHAAYHDLDIYRHLDQVTQGKEGTPEQRVFDALNTVHFELIPDAGKPTVIGYMEPLTDNEAEQEQLHSLMRSLDVFAGKYAFLHRSKRGKLAECAVCKSADHPSFLCHYTRPELGWWGPPAQLSELPPNHPHYVGPSNDGGNGGYGGGGGRGNGRGGYGRGGHPYSGGRGFPNRGGGGGGGYRGGGGGWRNNRGRARGRGY
ncbi:hypothetical protein B0H19DRAFT_1243316 [Mycena capillaripes]|nr:hypothetical protein B0H19DRAFT_1243316 [Mycena capillaripes]